MIKILIVEDDPMVAELNKRYINTLEGFEIVGVAYDGEEALKRLKNIQVDLVILDVYMPKLDGISVLKEIRNMSLEVDVILVTAAKEAENIDEVLKMGAVDYLIKPFEYERLKKSLENYKSRFKLLKNRQSVEQSDIDKITSNYNENQTVDIQKGVHRKTLERIRNFMITEEGETLTTAEIAENMQISTVTIRRYLEYLISTGEVALEIEYGEVGRPSYLYRYFGNK